MSAIACYRICVWTCRVSCCLDNEHSQCGLPQCGASAATGRIFYANCGARMRTPASLVPSDRAPEKPAARDSVLKRTTIFIIKAIGVVAALTFAFSRFTTNMGILFFGASIVIGFLCYAVLSYLDDDFLKEHVNEGSGPSKPLIGVLGGVTVQARSGRAKVFSSDTLWWPSTLRKTTPYFASRGKAFECNRRLANFPIPPSDHNRGIRPGNLRYA
jgi:hypothetical protein